MRVTRPGRPASQRSTMVSRTVLSVVRILIASYFLATATGLIFEPASRMFLDAVLSHQNATLATTIYLFATSFLIMVGKAVRPAALLLAVYIFWSGFLHYDIGGSPEALGAYWRDMALLGAVLLIAVTEPGGSGTFRLFRKPVAPRRVAPVLQSVDDARMRNVARPSRKSAQTARDAILTGEVLTARTAEQDDDDAILNIFADLWDAPLGEPQPAASNVFA